MQNGKVEKKSEKHNNFSSCNSPLLTVRSGQVKGLWKRRSWVTSEDITSPILTFIFMYVLFPLSSDSSGPVQLRREVTPPALCQQRD